MEENTEILSVYDNAARPYGSGMLDNFVVQEPF